MIEENDKMAGMFASWASRVSRDSYRDDGCLNVGELIFLLEDIDEDKHIMFEDGAFIAGFDSYRGTYSELAIGYGDGASLNPETVGEFVERLHEMLGKKIYGYKGGEYVVRDTTTVHKANSGECGQLIVAIRETDSTVEILARDEDDERFEEEDGLRDKLRRLKEQGKLKPTEPTESKSWTVNFKGPDGESVGTTEINTSDEKDADNQEDTLKLKITSFGGPAWVRFKSNSRMKKEFPNLIELVDTIRDIGNREEAIKFSNYTLTLSSLASEIAGMDKHINKLTNLLNILGSDANLESSALGRELEAYVGSFCRSVGQAWNKLLSTQNASRNDLEYFYTLLNNMGVHELEELMEEKLTYSWEEGEL